MLLGVLTVLDVRAASRHLQAKRKVRLKFPNGG